MNYKYTKIIDYLIFLKLMMHKRNIYFPNNFYVDWVKYLIPNFKKKYNLNLHFNYFDIYNKFNIKNYFNLFLEDKHDNLFFSIKSSIIRKFDFKILNFKIFFYNYNIIFFNQKKIYYEIPMKYLHNFKNKKLSFKDYNKFIIDIYENSCGLLMDHYILLNNFDKIINFELFKKVLLRFV